MRPFHLAFPVTDLEITKDFYTNILHCQIGRSSNEWIDFNLYGHQVVAHLVDNSNHVSANQVDGDEVPASHFGVILELSQWEELRDRLLNCGIQFIIEPKIRFRGEAGEQATMFFLDPCGNALEFKAFKDDNQIFAT